MRDARRVRLVGGGGKEGNVWREMTERSLQKKTQGLKTKERATRSVSRHNSKCQAHLTRPGTSTKEQRRRGGRRTHAMAASEGNPYASTSSSAARVPAHKGNRRLPPIRRLATSTGQVVTSTLKLDPPGAGARLSAPARTGSAAPRRRNVPAAGPPQPAGTRARSPPAARRPPRTRAP